MLKRLGQRAGIASLRPHRFRHTYAVSALRGGMPERVLQILGLGKDARYMPADPWS
ncbi:MAG: tyrosine-type recombinase/integrase [Dehalococcoidia bacterium]|nr:tyrosine-type recombinase/integrase [Dehalococcoidia bacterium]